MVRSASASTARGRAHITAEFRGGFKLSSILGKEMNGQWIGAYDGSNKGFLVVELDEVNTHFSGIACAYDAIPGYPGTFLHVHIPKGDTPFRGKLPLRPIHPDTGEPTYWDAISERFPGITHPTTADVTLELVDDVLKVSWTTDIGTHGTAGLPRSRAGNDSDLQPKVGVGTWSEFKSFVGDLEHRRYIFRGQSHPRRLRTTFHRTGRASIPRYLDEDILTLYRRVCSRPPMFDLNNPDQYGAFFSLAQHHGYPTPLLDWTYSPFVAAFFAYRTITNRKARLAGTSEKVRIFVFDQHAWREKLPQKAKLAWCRPHFSVMEFLAMGNERLVPQQSISAITNLDDIESYIRLAEETHKTHFLDVIDLPVNERPEVMKELSVMGITAGSLFPGLDGMCEELKERSFDF